jgi:serralysin
MIVLAVITATIRFSVTQVMIPCSVELTTTLGGIGADTMVGGAGNDIYVVDNIGDLVTETVNAGIDTVRTTLTTYTLKPNFERLTFVGAGNFIGTGNNLNNSIAGSAGNDRLFGNAGNDTLVGGAGTDTLNGGVGIDIMSGGLDNDTCFVDNSADKVNEAIGGGSDTVYASVNYALQAGQEVEFLRGNAGTVGLVLTGNGLNNSIVGLGGNDTLSGGNGNDALNGGNGIDRLAGGAGKDNLTGGPGPDSFIFDTALNAVTNVDHLLDFSIADRILLNQSIFTAAGAPGTLAANALFIGAGAHDADDRIIYNSGTGALIYDTNGNIAGGATQFAILPVGLTLTAATFVIV